MKKDKKNKTNKKVQEMEDQMENLTEELGSNGEMSAETENEAGEAAVGEKVNQELQESKDKYLRLYSEFENFRRRTAREKLELIDTAAAGLMTALIPVLDDFERAEKSMNDSDDTAGAMKEGLDLIYNKFRNTMIQKGLKPMETKVGDEFDADFHDAITQIPVEDEAMKGRIVDIVEKGYLLKEKVIRYAKVVIGG